MARSGDASLDGSYSEDDILFPGVENVNDWSDADQLSETEYADDFEEDVRIRSSWTNQW